MASLRKEKEGKLIPKNCASLRFPLLQTVLLIARTIFKDSTALPNSKFVAAPQYDRRYTLFSKAMKMLQSEGTG